MTTYKLTRQDNTTFGGCLWGEGVTHETSGEGNLCGPGWLHAYQHPLVAVFMNPIHADLSCPKLWECLGEGEYRNDHGLKCGFTRLTTVRKLPLPWVTKEQRVAFAILCAKEACKDPEWTVWANNWLRGADRNSDTARAAARAAHETACEAALVADWKASRAARVASRAAWAATLTADWEADAAYTAVLAADLAEIDLISLAQKAMKY